MDWVTFLQAVAVPLCGGLFWYLNDRIKSLKDDVEYQRQKVHEVEVNAARTYATRAELEKMEKRILEALDKLDSRIVSVLRWLPQSRETAND